jgi:2-C-methyl-D-erythritol 4-phosphate cytidylyltransferase/2-C-methyl-D-erythritol 2,4-cyclodiphosphate synthase
MLTGVGDRGTLSAAQTPQGVRRSLLQRAFERFPADGPDVFTDEAAMLEACNIPVHAIPGDPRNVKVTVPADLTAVEAMLTGTAAPRTGFGHDRHRFGPGEPLYLGGLAFDGAPRLHGHSDGDVALHAVADAILGAARMGDLGRLFPADARTERGVASDRLLAEVVARVRAGGLAVTSIDLTIVAARPRLSARLGAIGDRIAELVGLPPDRVSVKASTGNLEGMEGAGLGIAAEAIATVAPKR